jgi:hypothetical protein
MRRPLALRALALPALVATAAACTKQEAAGDVLSCSPSVHAVADEGHTHVPFCTPVAYVANPPASGSHWPAPHPWGVFFDRVVPREWWVHNLEHGGIVLVANCGPIALPDGGAVEASCSDAGVAPSGCADVTSVLSQVATERSPDQWGEVKVLATFDPLAPTKVTALAWDFTMPLDAPDLAALRCFRDARYDRGPENAP